MNVGTLHQSMVQSVSWEWVGCQDLSILILLEIYFLLINCHIKERTLGHLYFHTFKPANGKLKIIHGKRIQAWGSIIEWVETIYPSDACMYETLSTG